MLPSYPEFKICKYPISRQKLDIMIFRYLRNEIRFYLSKTLAIERGKGLISGQNLSMDRCKKTTGVKNANI